MKSIGKGTLKEKERKRRRKKKKRRMKKTTKYDYGKYPGEARFHMDQVPADFAQYGKSSYNDKGQGSCWIVGAAIDMEKRQHTMQLCFRAVAPQIMSPAVIFKD